MKIHESLEQHGLTQLELAKIISEDGIITSRTRTRAHRIWHGQKPSDDEMQLIFNATHGAVTANIWFGINDNPPPQFKEKLTSKAP